MFLCVVCEKLFMVLKLVFTGYDKVGETLPLVSLCMLLLFLLVHSIAVALNATSSYYLFIIFYRKGQRLLQGATDGYYREC